MRKHSISINGHSTSFSLEDPFWLLLKSFAAKDQHSVARVVTRIDRERAADTNLSSALRLYVLNRVVSEGAPEADA
jgi:predicted DNA-binding ribbon-helix-helix protein